MTTPEQYGHAEFPFRKGSTIALAKREILPGHSSGVPTGAVLHGALQRDIMPGKSIEVGESYTTGVKSLTKDRETGRILVHTRTSKYEVLDKSFEGLNLDTQLGSVHLPMDSQLAKLDNTVFHHTFLVGPYYDANTKETYDDVPAEVYINKPALKGVLVESHGAQIFNGMRNRFFVIAKVGSIHLPFYTSLYGTSGKNPGEWHPFFGYVAGWIIKGHVSSDGKMHYHPEIDRINRLLNQNLKVPLWISPESGKMGRYKEKKEGVCEPDIVSFDLNNHLIFKSLEYYDSKGVTDVEEVTGYKPMLEQGFEFTKDPTGFWINSIVKSIK
ncbi:MAG: hypothetical protein Q8P26_00955 [Candidatus Levybacteria bacterium]|nr:hypothetical protein [Candidatus Levybacteria bacterium]